MEQQYNRVEADLKKWQEKERNLETIQPGTTKNNRDFLHTKLDFLENLQLRYTGSMSFDERLMLSALKNETRALKVLVYPNRFIRLLRDLVSLFKKKQSIKEQWRNANDNEQQLSDTLKRLGFEDAVSKLSTNIKHGRDSFCIPLSSYFEERERLDLDLHFSKVGFDRYEFTHYNAALISSSKVVCQHQFSVSQPWHPNNIEMINFLSGRPVLKTLDNQYEQRWVQLDMNDKDAQGNHRVKLIKHSQDYDLVDVLKKSGLSEKHLAMSFEKATELLKAGAQLRVVSGTDPNSCYLMEASPLHRSIRVCDDLGTKATFEDILSQNDKTLAKANKQDNRQENRRNSKALSGIRK